MKCVHQYLITIIKLVQHNVSVKESLSITVLINDDWLMC